MREEDLEDFSKFLAEFQEETDRGGALVGAALLDLKLADTLRAFMVSANAAEPLLDGATAPLGTFSARIKAAFAFGLIDDHERRECDLIRKVRNEFAHRPHGFDFQDQKVAALCEQLQSDLPGDRDKFSGKYRTMFINAVILTVLRLTYRAEHVAMERRTTRSWPY